MKLLFKEEGFSREFKNLLGFVDADMKFRSIRADLKTATREVRKIIGNAFYDSVVALYQSDSATANDKELVENVRYPIAMNAYRMYAPTNDLKHSNNGRTMRSDDKEKSPFPWMIDLDNKNQEKKYYRALDDLLSYLTDEDIEGWKNSEAYKQYKKYFVTSTADFEDYFPIESRYLLIKLMPAFRKCEREQIIPAIGLEKFQQLKNDFQSDTGVLDEDNQLVKLIKEACVYFSLAWGMRRLSAQLFPEGILQRYISERMAVKASKVPEQMESQLAAQEFDKDVQKVLAEIEDEVTPQPIPNDNPREKQTFSHGFDDDDNFVTT